MPRQLSVVRYEGAHTDTEVDLFGAYRLLYPIIVLGRTYFVPEDNTVLRALQYLELKHDACHLPWGNFCWNGTTGCCEMVYRESPDGPAIEGRACSVRVKAGMEILQLPKGADKCHPKR